MLSMCLSALKELKNIGQRRAAPGLFYVAKALMETGLPYQKISVFLRFLKYKCDYGY
jgi:hypothetical protein